MKQVIIIGGGVSGLTTAVYAQRAGFQAVVVEKNPVPGGECTGWDRQGCHIDNCIHWLMGTTPGTALYEIYRETGALGDGVEVYRPEKMYTSELNGQSITLWADLERTRRELLALSPKDREEIERLIGAVKLAQRVRIPAEMAPELMRGKDLAKMMFTSGAMLKLVRMYREMDIADLGRRFRHPLIRAMLADFCPEQSMAYSFATAYGNFVSGDGGIPRGGSRTMALRMARRCEELGVRLLLGQPARRIRVEDGHGTGVELENGQFLEGDYIVSACDPSHTLARLLAGRYREPMLEKVYERRRDYPVFGMFQAAFLADSQVDAVNGDLMLPSGAARDEEWISERMSVKSYSYEPGFAPEGKQVLQVLLGLTEEAWPIWEALYRDKAAYHARKQELAEKIKGELEKRFPEYRGKLTLLDCWTPATYVRWCNGYKGYNQAYIITKCSDKNPYPGPWLEGLDNVVLSGQWLSPPGGIPGAVIQGKYAVQRIQARENGKKKEERAMNGKTARRPWYLFAFCLLMVFLYTMGIYDLFMMLGHDPAYYGVHGYGQEVEVYFTGYPLPFLVCWVLNLICGWAAPVLLLLKRRGAKWAAWISAAADFLLIVGTAALRNRIGILGLSVFCFDLFILALTVLFWLYCRAAEQ